MKKKIIVIEIEIQIYQSEKIKPKHSRFYKDIKEKIDLLCKNEENNYLHTLAINKKLFLN